MSDLPLLAGVGSVSAGLTALATIATYKLRHHRGLQDEWRDDDKKLKEIVDRQVEEAVANFRADVAALDGRVIGELRVMRAEAAKDNRHVLDQLEVIQSIATEQKASIKELERDLRAQELTCASRHPGEPWPPARD